MALQHTASYWWRADGTTGALEELAAAKTWLAARPQYALEPTVLRREFIKTR